MYRGPLLTVKELTESGGRNGNCSPGTRFCLIEQTEAYESVRGIAFSGSQPLILEEGAEAIRLDGVHLDDVAYVWIRMVVSREKYLVSGEVEVEVIESPPCKDQAMFLFPPP